MEYLIGNPLIKDSPLADNYIDYSNLTAKLSRLGIKGMYMTHLMAVILFRKLIKSPFENFLLHLGQ